MSACASLKTVLNSAWKNPVNVLSHVRAISRCLSQFSVSRGNGIATSQISIKQHVSSYKSVNISTLYQRRQPLYPLLNVRTFTSLQQVPNFTRPLLPLCLPNFTARRTKVRYGRKSGKAKTVKPVMKRFYRLEWGIWIRPKSGRNKRKWTKHSKQLFRLRQHVFCNKQQSKLLDKMVTDHWKKRRQLPHDPYNPYHKRTNLPEFFPEKIPFLP